MKYIPILASRDAEIITMNEINNSNVIPYIRIIKNKYRSNSIHTFSEELKNRTLPFFCEISYSSNPGNVQAEIAAFLKSMCNNNLYFEKLKEFSAIQNANIVIDLQKAMNFTIQNLNTLGDISFKFDAPQDLSYVLIDESIKFKYAFINFNPESLSGVWETNFNKFYQKFKEKIIFIFENHEIKYPNIDAPREGKCEKNPILYKYENYSNCFGFADYCMQTANELPAAGGVLSPGIKIQIDTNILLRVGDSTFDLEKASFAGYTRAVKNLFQNEVYMKKRNIFEKSPSYQIVSDASNTTNAHLITPLKAKYISMSHYIQLILSIIENAN